MGGNALDFDTKRLTRDEYFRTWNFVRDRVQDAYPDVELHLIEAFAEKEDFGDMDVLVKKNDNPNLKWDLLDLFDNRDHYNNGNCLSFDVDGFQVDFVFMKPKWWETAKVFFSFNDLNNLVGKVARNRRVKWGFQGLRMEVHTDDYSKKLGEFTLTLDPRRAYEFLGFDYDRYLEGFDTLNDIFEFVRSCDYFNHAMFMPEALTADQRHRDTKRKVYELFMDYLETVPEVEYPRLSRQEALELVDREFPEVGLLDEVNRLKRREEMRREAKGTFNGNVAIEATGLTGKELGTALGRFQKEFDGKDEYYQFLLDHSRDEVVDRFKKVNGLD